MLVQSQAISTLVARETHAQENRLGDTAPTPTGSPTGTER
jgi:hypothetical protein